jgi:hypothetical protein
MSGGVCSMMSLATLGFFFQEMNMSYAKLQSTHLEKVYISNWNISLCFSFFILLGT